NGFEGDFHLESSGPGRWIRDESHPRSRCGVRESLADVGPCEGAGAGKDGAAAAQTHVRGDCERPTLPPLSADCRRRDGGTGRIRKSEVGSSKYKPGPARCKRAGPFFFWPF